MTYDVAIWKQPEPLTDAEARAEFERRFILAEHRYGQWDPPCPELKELFGRMRERFAGAGDWPWEGPDDGDLSPDADDDFVYVSMPWREATAVIEFVAGLAPGLGLVVYDPQADALVS